MLIHPQSSICPARSRSKRQVAREPGCSLPLCELGCSVFPLPAFLPFRQRPLVDNIRSGKKDAAEERGGAAFYVNNKPDHFIRNDLSICQKEFETICTEIKCNRNKNILCFCIHRHPNTDQEKFLQFLDSVLQKVAKEKKIAYIMGDFNFDLLNYAADNNTFDFLNTIVESGFLPLIHQPTRITETTGTLIDNIFSNNFEHETLSGNLLIKISDHLSQFAVVKRSVDISKAAKYMIIKTLFLADFTIQNWSNLENHDIGSCEKFNDVLWRVNSFVDRHAPMKRLSKKQIKRHLKPWITNRIIKMMSHRDKLFLKWNKNRGDVQTNHAYKKFRNRTRQEIRESKRELYRHISRCHV